MDSQLSALNSQLPLWSRQPDEDPVDYQLLAAWLQLPLPRPNRKAAAAALGCSRHCLSRRFTRQHWKIRTTAFDNHRAHAASRALDELLRQESKDLQERARDFRLQEWLLHEQMFASATTALARFEAPPGRASLADVIRLLELSSVLGRRACGLPVNPGAPKPEPPVTYPEVEACLRKIYGSENEAFPEPPSPNQ
jgi:hypothetical protein